MSKPRRKPTFNNYQFSLTDDEYMLIDLWLRLLPRRYQETEAAGLIRAILDSADHWTPIPQYQNRRSGKGFEPVSSERQ